jgi:hypothetical protein
MQPAKNGENCKEEGAPQATRSYLIETAEGGSPWVS